MSLLREQVTHLVTPIAESKGAYVVDVVIRGDHRKRVVEVFVDHDNGVTTDLCAEISRELSRAIDHGDSIPHRYDLVVSSPGLDRPLKFSRQYKKNLGRTAEIKYTANGQTMKVAGTLTSANDHEVEIMSGKDTRIKIMLEQILETRIKPVW
jgi:ribosome maturation factor RimP